MLELYFCLDVSPVQTVTFSHKRRPGHQTAQANKSFMKVKSGISIMWIQLSQSTDLNQRNPVDPPLHMWHVSIRQHTSAYVNIWILDSVRRCTIPTLTESLSLSLALSLYHKHTQHIHTQHIHTNTHITNTPRRLFCLTVLIKGMVSKKMAWLLLVLHVLQLH